MESEHTFLRQEKNQKKTCINIENKLKIQERKVDGAPTKWYLIFSLK